MTTLPGEMWFGTISGEWPVQCWESEAHAAAWYAKPAAAGHKKKLWKARLTVLPGEFEAVVPTPYLKQKARPANDQEAPA